MSGTRTGKYSPENLITAIVESNRTRRDYVTGKVLRRVNDLVYFCTLVRFVGALRLIMKLGFINFRASSVQSFIKSVKARGVSVLVYAT